MAASQWQPDGVVGGGAVGSGIAFDVARALDARIILREVDEQALGRARANDGERLTPSPPPRDKGAAGYTRRRAGHRFYDYPKGSGQPA